MRERVRFEIMDSRDPSVIQGFNIRVSRDGKTGSFVDEVFGFDNVLPDPRRG